MNKYELALVVNAKAEDDVRTATVEKAKEYIEHMREAYYYFIQFDADATCPAEVEKHVRIMENVIRYLCVRKDA